MSEQKIEINLFDFIPFDEERIKKLALLISDNNRLLKKEMFYIKDEQGKTFIENLIEMDKPNSREEMHIRVYLLGYFYYDGIIDLKNKVASIEKPNIFMEQLAKVSEKYYDEFCSIRNFTPKYLLNDYLNKIENITNQNKPVAELKEELKEILTQFCEPFQNAKINYAKELIAPLALIAKMVILKKDAPNIRKLTLPIYFDMIGKEYQYESNRNLLIQVASTTIATTIRTEFVLPEKQDGTELLTRGLIDNLSLTILTDLVSEILLNNKIMMNYETLNVELAANEKPKNKKTKL
jgi:hypothetical protein